MIVEAGKIRELATAVEQIQERADLAREDVASAVAAAKAAGIDPKALKLALSIRKAKPAKAKVFLDSFDACRDALGLDDQLDIEDAIDAAEKLDAMAGPSGGATLTDGNGNVLAEFGKGEGIRKARGRARELN